MHVRKTEKGYFLRLETGEEIIGALAQFAKQENIRMASFVAIGATTELTLGYYTLSEKQYHWKEFAGEFEILSATGNISIFDGSPMVHMHGTFSGPDFFAFGGHVKKAHVGASCEIMLTVEQGSIERTFDELTGLNLWKL